MQKDIHKILTEDLGKIFEKAICLCFDDIPYDGIYKYSLDEAEKLSIRIKKIKDNYPYELTHTASKSNRYDFTGKIDSSIKLSAKTTKKDGKVCPSVIGQPSKKNFCNFFKITKENSDTEYIKKFIIQNAKQMLNNYEEYTFDCPILYYNKKTDKCLFIIKIQNIEWEKYDISFSHITKNKKWNESTTITIDNISIGEFQVHNHRDCIKFRWAFEKILKKFKDVFDIIEI